MPRSMRFVVPPERSGGTLAAFLAASGRLDRDQTSQIVETGGVFVNRRRVKTQQHRLRGGDKVEVHLADLSAAHLATEHVSVLFVDEHLLVVDKPAGVPVQATRQSDKYTLLEAARAHLQSHPEVLPEAQRRPPVSVWAPHRLDREVSGVVALATSLHGAQDVTRQLGERTASRRYLGFVRANVSGAMRLEHWLRPDGRGGVIASGCVPDAARSAHGDGKLAVTHVKPLSQAGGHTLVQLELETGRMHQIRAQLAAAGAPLVGDLRYNGGLAAPTLQFNRPALHALTLTLLHPGNKRPLTCVAPLPADLLTLASKLELSLPEGTTAAPEGARNNTTRPDLRAQTTHTTLGD